MSFCSIKHEKEHCANCYLMLIHLFFRPSSLKVKRYYLRKHNGKLSSKLLWRSGVLVLFSICCSHRRTGTFGLGEGGGGGGGGDLIARNKITQCPKACVVQTHSNRSKNKMFTILTSNDRIITPELQLNPNFSHLQEKRKLVRKIGYVEKSG